jgi:hypothetical protein
LAFLGLFAVCAAVHEARAQTVAHPLAGETLAVETASRDTSVIAFKNPGNAVTQYQMPFEVSSVSKLYVEGRRAFLVGTTASFEFGASFGAAPAQVGMPGAVMIGYGISISPKADYLAWVQFYPRLALAPDRGTVRLMK